MQRDIAALGSPLSLKVSSTFDTAQSYQSAQHSSWGPSSNTLRRRRILPQEVVTTSANERPLAAQAVYRLFFYENLFVPFVIGTSRALVPIMVQYTELKIDLQSFDHDETIIQGSLPRLACFKLTLH